MTENEGPIPPPPPASRYFDCPRKEDKYIGKQKGKMPYHHLTGLDRNVENRRE